MAGFDRYRHILELFTEAESSWTVAEIADVLKTPASTIYRNVRELVGAGFLESAKGSYFRLGPAFIAFDRTILRTDPLVTSGAAFLPRLVEDLPIPGAVVLARLYGDQVMCVADASSPQAHFSSSYQRGRPMPIVRGATSKAILAEISGKRLDCLLDAAGLTDSVTRQAFVEEMAKIRRDRFSSTRGEVDPDLIGFAVPVRNAALGIDASLTCIFEQRQYSQKFQQKIFADLMAYSHLIETHMQSLFDQIASSREETVQAEPRIRSVT